MITINNNINGVHVFELYYVWTSATMQVFARSFKTVNDNNWVVFKAHNWTKGIILCTI